MELFRLISYSTAHICAICYILIFIRWRYSAKKTIAIAFGAMLILISLEVVRYLGMSRGVRQVWPIVMQIMFMPVVTIYLSQYRDFRGLFTGLTSINYTFFGNVIARSIHTLGGGIVWSVLSGVVIHSIFIIGLIRYLRPSYMAVQLENRREWPRLCMLPISFYISLLLLMHCMGGKSLLQYMVMLSLMFTLYLTYFLLFQMIQNVRVDEQMKKEREMLENNAKAIKHSMEEVQLAERKIAIQIHDRRHQSRVMQSLMMAKDYDAVNQLLAQEQGVQDYLIGSHYCDNVTINGVICYYVAMARENQITVHVAVDISSQILVDEWELAVVIGNLLENAVQAATEVAEIGKRTIWLTGKQIRGQLLIEIQNTYDETIEFDVWTSLPKSKQGEGHGLGLGSVAYFAERSHANFDCGIEDGRFFARLLV